MNVCLKEQTECIQNQIKKIRNSVKERQSRIGWQTANEVNKRKSTSSAKLKATSQEERIHLWKQYFENLFGKPPKVMHESIAKIINNELDIKLGQFTQEELDSVLRKIKIGKEQGLVKYPQKYGTQGNSTTYCSDIVYNHNTTDRWTKGCILLFPKKGEISE